MDRDRIWLAYKELMANGMRRVPIATSTKYIFQEPGDPWGFHHLLRNMPGPATPGLLDQC